MMGRSRFPRFATATMLVAMTACPAFADDRKFFERIEGVWSGPGQIVAGKYEGTRFNCDIAGTSLAPKKGMTLKGKCRIGLFSQTISATLEQDGGEYTGTFLDGAKGKGLDVVSASVDGDRATIGMKRPELSGAMVARMKSDGRLGVTVSVRVNGKLLPVIGMNMSRAVDNMATSSVSKD